MEKKTIDFPFPIKGIEKGETEIYVNLDKRKDKIVRSAELLVWDLEERA